MTSYTDTYRRALERPEEFWAEAAAAIDWERRWDRVLDDTRPPTRLRSFGKASRVKNASSLTSNCTGKCVALPMF